MGKFQTRMKLKSSAGNVRSNYGKVKEFTKKMSEFKKLQRDLLRKGNVMQLQDANNRMDDFASAWNSGARIWKMSKLRPVVFNGFRSALQVKTTAVGKSTNNWPGYGFKTFSRGHLCVAGFDWDTQRGKANPRIYPFGVEHWTPQHGKQFFLTENAKANVDERVLCVFKALCRQTEKEKCPQMVTFNGDIYFLGDVGTFSGKRVAHISHVENGPGTLVMYSLLKSYYGFLNLICRTKPVALNIGSYLMNPYRRITF